MHFKEINSYLLLLLFTNEFEVNQITIALPVFSISNHVQLIAQRHIFYISKATHTLHLSTFESYSVTKGMLMLLDYAQPKN